MFFFPNRNGAHIHDINETGCCLFAMLIRSLQHDVVLQMPWHSMGNQSLLTLSKPKTSHKEAVFCVVEKSRDTCDDQGGHFKIFIKNTAGEPMELRWVQTNGDGL